MHEWVNRKDRYPVEVDALIFRSDGKKSCAKLTDFSDQGCKIHFLNGLDLDERVQIAIPRMGTIKATIRWIAGKTAGAKFLIEADF